MPDASKEVQAAIRGLEGLHRAHDFLRGILMAQITATYDSLYVEGFSEPNGGVPAEELARYRAETVTYPKDGVPKGFERTALRRWGGAPRQWMGFRGEENFKDMFRSLPVIAVQAPDPNYILDDAQQEQLIAYIENWRRQLKDHERAMGEIAPRLAALRKAAGGSGAAP